MRPLTTFPHYTLDQYVTPASSSQKVRMGASALFSALNALPWEGDEEDEESLSDEEDERPRRKMGATVVPQRAQRPKGRY